MKPQIIGAFADWGEGEPQAPAERLARTPGEVDTIACAPDEWDFPLLIDAVRSAGYEPARRCLYQTYDFTIAQDSVPWHRDEGCHLLVIMPVVMDDPYTPAQLITRHGPLNLRIGDIAVFNASLGHAWINNGYCELASMTVKKVRRR